MEISSIITTEKERFAQFNRKIVLNDYTSAETRSNEMYAQGDAHAGKEYIYANQKEDACQIVARFCESNVRVVSIMKRTKLGMDGLMIEIAKLVTTHPDDEFMLNRNHVFMLTGMNNVSWAEDMQENMPNCFRENVYHHGHMSVTK